MNCKHSLSTIAPRWPRPDDESKTRARAAPPSGGAALVGLKCRLARLSWISEASVFEIATQTATSLATGLLGSDRLHDLGEVPHACVGGNELSHHARDLLLEAVERHVARHPPGFLDRAQVFLPRTGAAQEAFDHEGGLLAVADRIDKGRWAPHCVAAGEHLGMGRPEVDPVRRYRPPRAHRELAGQPAQIDRQTDGRDDRVAGDDELRARDRPGEATSALVRLAKLHTHALEPGGPTVVADQDAGWSRQILEPQAFFIALQDLPCVGRHLVARAPVDQGHITLPALDRLQAERTPGRVHGDRTSTDDDHPVADRSTAVEVDVSEELHAGQDTRHVVVLDPQALRDVRAQSQEDRIVAVRQE